MRIRISKKNWQHNC